MERYRTKFPGERPVLEEMFMIVESSTRTSLICLHKITTLMVSRVLGKSGRQKDLFFDWSHDREHLMPRRQPNDTWLDGAYRKLETMMQAVGLGVERHSTWDYAGQVARMQYQGIVKSVLDWRIVT